MNDEATDDRARHFANPYPAYTAVREQRLVREERGAWYASRYEDVDFILKIAVSASSGHRIGSSATTIDGRMH